jgi:hypothetical protein
MTDRAEMEAAIEAVLFVSSEPVPRERLAEIFDEGDREAAAEAIAAVSLEAALVRLGLIGLQFRADIVADIHIGNVDREDLEGRAGVEALFENLLGDSVRVFQHLFVRVGRADGGDDAFADAGDDGFLGRAADELEALSG